MAQKLFPVTGFVEMDSRTQMPWPPRHRYNLLTERALPKDWCQCAEIQVLLHHQGNQNAFITTKISFC